MRWTRNKDDSYSVVGIGPMRKIIVEGQTRQEARTAWMEEFAIQYAEQEAASRPSYAGDPDDIRTTNYRGGL